MENSDGEEAIRKPQCSRYSYCSCPLPVFELAGAPVYAYLSRSFLSPRHFKACGCDVSFWLVAEQAFLETGRLLAVMCVLTDALI